jgi:DNA-binding response OmpR family regulator
MVAEHDLKKDTLQTSVQKKKYRVMIVDDEQDITAIFKIGLEKNQFIVTTFNDPLEALSKFRPRLYDLVILDIRMPGMNGFQLYEKIRGLDDKVKVCFLTAFEESRGVFRNSFPLLEEVNCYLKKPITVQDLIKRLVDIANS